MEKMELKSEDNKGENRRRRRVGLIHDERMCKHFAPDDDYHPENPNRILAIWNKLKSSGITQRCVVLSAKEAEDKYIAAVHTKNHIDLIKNISSEKFDSRRERIAAKYNSIYFNEGSSEAAYLAAGSVLEVAEKVAKGELDSAFAIVRPPGHHAEENEPMGFCLHNNVAVATSFLLNKRELGIKKILIVDWDVHHGNGTQKMFWKDPRVLFFSVHRYDFGTFYPASEDGSHIMIGKGPGAGYNINVPWESGRCGDADYIAAWDHVLIPVAKEFNPDIIMISAGFDAAVGDPLGGCRVTPYGYSVMLKKLMESAQGKIVMALEGGYNLDSIANSVLACVEVLVEEKPLSGSSEAYPFESTWRVIQAVREKLSPFWPILKYELSKKLTDGKAPPIQISCSDSDGENDICANIVSEDLEKAVQDVLQPFSELRVGINSNDEVSTVSAPWRLELSKIDVWYATFGSNMCKSRFLCYIQGGQVEGMIKACAGSLDKSPPKEILWKTVPHRLFFGHDQSKAWGPGGVAFLHPESNSQNRAYMCLYRITLEQFNDVLLQENVSRIDLSSPAFDLTDLDSIMEKGKSVEVLEKVVSGVKPFCLPTVWLKA
ncbi:histone deacetylase 5 isoform X2 [Rhododendron vialii]|uniref:histone deacetylase 5 isoform X2 n=1 Tax=Rhododendron vialii TaxID=182163 RepID=UPI00265D83DC|nr:histone deacetylase 5 isoform X2 [Rhododendron vialii]